MKRTLEDANAVARELVHDHSGSTDEDAMPGVTLPRTPDSIRFFTILMLMHDERRFDLLDEFNALGLKLGGPLRWKTIVAPGQAAHSAAFTVALRTQDVDALGERLLKRKTFIFDRANGEYIGAALALPNIVALLDRYGTTIYKNEMPSPAVYEQFVLGILIGLVRDNTSAEIDAKIHAVANVLSKAVKMTKDRYRALAEVAFIPTDHYLRWYTAAGAASEEAMRGAIEIEQFTTLAGDMYRLYRPTLEPITRFEFILNNLRPQQARPLLRECGLALNADNDHAVQAVLLYAVSRRILPASIYEALNEWDATYFSWDNLWDILGPYLVKRPNLDAAEEFIQALNLSGNSDERTIRDIASEVVQGGHTFFLERFFRSERESDSELVIPNFDAWMERVRFDRMLAKGASISRNDTFASLLALFYLAYPSYENEMDAMKGWAFLLTKMDKEGIEFILTQPQSFVDFDGNLLPYFLFNLAPVLETNPMLFAELDFLPHFLAKRLVSVEAHAAIEGFLTRYSPQYPELAKYAHMLKGESANTRVDARNILAQIGFWAKRLVRPLIAGKSLTANWAARFAYDPKAQNFSLSTPPARATVFGMSEDDASNGHLHLSYGPFLKSKNVEPQAPDWPKTTSVHRLETPSTAILHYVNFPDTLKGGGFGHHLLRLLEQACASNSKNVQAVLLEWVHFPLFSLVQQRHGWEAVSADGVTEYGRHLLKYIKFSLNGQDDEAMPNRNKQFDYEKRQSFTWIPPLLHAILDMHEILEPRLHPWAEGIFEKMDEFLRRRDAGRLTVENPADAGTFLRLQLTPLAKTEKGLAQQHYLYALGNQDDRPMSLHVGLVDSERGRKAPTALVPSMISYATPTMWGVLVGFLVRQSQLWCRPLILTKATEANFQTQAIVLASRPEVRFPYPRFEATDGGIQFIPRFRPKQYELVKNGVGWGVRYTPLPATEDDYSTLEAEMARLKNWNYEANRPARPDEDLWKDGNPRLTPFHSVFIQGYS